MVSYNNSNVVQCLRQYDMFANSLNLVKKNIQPDFYNWYGKKMCCYGDSNTCVFRYFFG